ncbi:MAG: lipoyl synthase [Gammaproteobacteria bacterium]|nr:lipoyl synthase [Gammaproteobacteria bacterium]
MSVVPFKERSRSAKRSLRQTGQVKTKIPIEVVEKNASPSRPLWLRVRVAQNSKASRVKRLLHQHRLHSVCEEAACPNLPECFGNGTATFMIMGDICTRRCRFCDVATGRPLPLDINEPRQLAKAVNALQLSYVVITSVDRDDLDDGGAGHFAACIREVKALNLNIKIEILVPDFRRRESKALQILSAQPPDVFNHNLETVPSLYRRTRPGADYKGSLLLLKRFKSLNPRIPAKSGLMLGMGETDAEVREVMCDLREHDCDMLTLGQYLQPSRGHLCVDRYVSPYEFDDWRDYALGLGFSNVASGPLVRSSYHADSQAADVLPVGS